jgi:predicted nucleic-acid-binding Zn-ribbon protein
MRLKKYIIESKTGMGIDGLSKSKVKTLIYKETKKCTYNKLYKDQSWQGPQCIWDTFDKLDLNWQIDSSDYKNYNKGKMADAKEWKFTIMWDNDKGKSIKQSGLVTASGAGSVDDPLEKYDLNLVIF